MTKAEMAVMDDALSLPVEMRVQLVDKLIQSLNLPIQRDVEEAWAKEIERRVSQVEKGEVALVPGEEVFARLRRKHRR